MLRKNIRFFNHATPVIDRHADWHSVQMLDGAYWETVRTPTFICHTLRLGNTILTVRDQLKCCSGQIHVHCLFTRPEISPRRLRAYWCLITHSQDVAGLRLTLRMLVENGCKPRQPREEFDAFEVACQEPGKRTLGDESGAEPCQGDRSSACLGKHPEQPSSCK